LRQAPARLAGRPRVPHSRLRGVVVGRSPRCGDSDLRAELNATSREVRDQPVNRRDTDLTEEPVEVRAVER
jgi:hypothetical protein